MHGVWINEDKLVNSMDAFEKQSEGFSERHENNHRCNTWKQGCKS